MPTSLHAAADRVDHAYASHANASHVNTSHAASLHDAAEFCSQVIQQTSNQLQSKHALVTV